MLLTSEPATRSSEAIADIKIANFIRKQPDLEENKEEKSMIDSAKKFYSDTAARGIGLKARLYIFAFHLRSLAYMKCGICSNNWRGFRCQRRVQAFTFQ